MEENEIFLALCVLAAIWGQGRPQKSELCPDGALRTVAYAKVTMAERLENPFDGAGNCYILYGLTKEPVKSDSLMLPTSDNIFYACNFSVYKSRFAVLKKYPAAETPVI